MFKVQDSMSNLETVVRERNKAYYDLEVGEIGERPGELVTNQLGKLYKKHIYILKNKPVHIPIHII